MSVVLYRLVGIGLACVLVAPASAQLLARKGPVGRHGPRDRGNRHRDLQDERLSGVGHDRRAQRRGCRADTRRRDRTPHHGEQLQEGLHVAHVPYPVRRDGRPVEAEIRRWAHNISPASPPARGALPIKVGEDVIGAAGVSGAPGGEKDEACVKAGARQGRRPAQVTSAPAADRAGPQGSVMTRLSRGSLARARCGFAAAASIAALWAFPGNAQTYPDRPIRVIVPIAAGKRDRRHHACHGERAHDRGSASRS